MKRYKRKLTEEDMIDNTKENRDIQINNIAEDFAEWMSFCYGLYIGHQDGFDSLKNNYMKEGLSIAKINVKIKKLKTADDIYYYREDMLSKIFSLKKKLGVYK
jgi:hypothetical protein